jgi:integrating conjugative element protein (TIGR03761 family)
MTDVEKSAGLTADAVKKPVEKTARTRKKVVAEVASEAGSLSADTAASSQSKMGAPLFAPMTNSLKPVPKKAKRLFADGYDIDAERLSLAELISAENPDTSSPLWPRYLELLGREEALAKQATNNKLRQQADPIVSDVEALKMSSIGGLRNEDADSMSLHTKEAMRLFMGRMADDETSRYGAVSGKRVSAVLRFLWLATGGDNPYADWGLVQVETKVSELRQEFDRRIKTHEAVFTALAKRNLRYSVMVSRAPAVVELGFKSPYGYLIAELIVDFDYLVRLVKTLVAKDRLSKTDGRNQIYESFKALRSFFEKLVPYQRILQTEEIKKLSRADWVSTADDESRKRVNFVVKALGVCPREIFSGEVIPRHTRRNGGAISEVELNLLRTVNLEGLGIGTGAKPNAEQHLV